MRSTVFMLAVAATASPAAAQLAGDLSGSVEYQEGDYGTGESIETTTARAGLRLQAGKFTIGATLPYHRLEAPGNVVGSDGGLLGIIIDPTRPATREVREGVGDLRVHAGYRLPRLAGIDAAVNGEVKLATAADGLGTGEADVSFGAELARTFGAVTPFASLSYTMPGDPQGFALRNSLAARGGVSAQLSRGVRGTVAYGYAESVSPLVRDEEHLSTEVEIGLSQRLTLGVSGTAGLSTGSPDIGAGIRIGWRPF